MDATKKPLRIPPQFAIYAENHGLFQVYERLLQQLIINQPDDPLTFMINLLEEPEEIDVPRIIVCGPPVSGKKTICKLLAEKLNCIHLTKESLFNIKDEDNCHVPYGIKMTDMIRDKMRHPDCINKGWLIEGFPETKQQAVDMQAAGIMPNHFILLETDDVVLLERAIGKRIDPLTGDVYHTTFDSPSDQSVLQRLETDPYSEENALKKRLREYRRCIASVSGCYTQRLKTVNADQPKNDVLSECISFTKTTVRSNAPHTPRILLVGATGSGKSTQAELLAKRYKLVNVDCDQLVEQAMTNDSKEGQAMKPYLERNVDIPDDMLLHLVTSLLSGLDATINGWVLHGFPMSRTQADALNKACHNPNYIITLNLSQDVILERLALRAVDPVTGQRYHELYDPPQTEAIKNRLRYHADDSEEAVLTRISKYQQEVDDLLDLYNNVHHLEADQDPSIVFDNINGLIINPNKRSKIDCD